MDLMVFKKLLKSGKQYFCSSQNKKNILSEFSFFVNLKFLDLSHKIRTTRLTCIEIMKISVTKKVQRTLIIDVSEYFSTTLLNLLKKTKYLNLC